MERPLPDFVALAQMVAQDLLGLDSLPGNAPTDAAGHGLPQQGTIVAEQQSEPGVTDEQPESTSPDGDGANGNAQPNSAAASNEQAGVSSPAQNDLPKPSAEASTGSEISRKRPADTAEEDHRKRQHIDAGEPSHMAEEKAPAHNVDEVQAAAQQGQREAAPDSVEQAKLAALAKLEAINAQLSQVLIQPVCLIDTVPAVQVVGLWYYWDSGAGSAICLKSERVIYFACFLDPENKIFLMYNREESRLEGMPWEAMSQMHWPPNLRRRMPASCRRPSHRLCCSPALPMQKPQRPQPRPTAEQPRCRSRPWHLRLRALTQQGLQR